MNANACKQIDHSTYLLTLAPAGGASVGVLNRAVQTVVLALDLGAESGCGRRRCRLALAAGTAVTQDFTTEQTVVPTQRTSCNTDN